MAYKRGTYIKALWGLAVSAALTVPIAGAKAETLVFAQGADIHRLDPAVTNSTTSHIVMRHIFNGLVKWNDSSMTSIEPDLATSWSQSEDGLEWVFELRDDVEFHDGTPFDAEAVKFNLERLLAEETGSPVRSLFEAVDEVEVLDTHKVAIRSRAPIPTLLELLVDEYGFMSSPTAVQADPDTYVNNPVGTGPYIFQEWIPNEHTIVARNPDYFGNPGIPDEIVFRPIPENSARMIEIETGNVDIAATIPPENAGQIEANEDVELLVVPGSFQIFFELNTTDEPFDDIRIRKAASLAIDRQAIVDNLLSGYGNVPSSPLPEGVQGRVELGPLGYDPDRARELIEEVYPGGYDGTIVLWTPAGRYTKDLSVAQAVQAYLNAVGLKTEFRSWEWAAYQRQLYLPMDYGTGRGTNEADMWLLGTGITNTDRRLRGKLVEGDGSNLTGYANPRVQDLMAQASTELDYQKRMRLYGEVQQIVWEEEPNNIPLFDQVQILAVRDGVTAPAVFSDEIILLDQVSISE